MRIGNAFYLRTWGAAAALSLLMTACDKKEGPPPAAPPPAPVTVNQPVSKDVTDWDEYPGRMDAVEMVDVKARVSGYLQSINFKDGAEVKKGDLLFVIDPRPYQAELDRVEGDLQQALTRLQLMSNDVARANRMLETKAMSAEEADSRAKNLQMAVAAVASARAATETAHLNMDYTHITAPITGRIGRKMLTEGNLVNGGQGQATELTTIVSVDPMYCYFDADERSIQKYQKLAHDGQGDNMSGGKVVCEAGLASETGYPHKGVIDFVDNVVDPTTGTMRLRAVFSNPDRVLQPGFFARVRVPGSAAYHALLIPDQAVGTDQSVKYVMTVNPTNVVEFHVVSLGPLVDGLRVVQNGLKADDWVVVNGLFSARPGATVNPQKVAIGATPNQPAAGAAQ